MNDPDRLPGYVDTVPLDAEWRAGNLMVWHFQRPTRVFSLELRGDITGAELLSIKVEGFEQLAQVCHRSDERLALVALAQPAAALWRNLPDGNWIIGPLMLPPCAINGPFEVQLSNFRGELRPRGQQVPGE